MSDEHDESANPDRVAAAIRRAAETKYRTQIASLEAQLAATQAELATRPPMPERWTDLAPEQQRAELDASVTWAEHVAWRQRYETRTNEEWIKSGREVWAKGVSK